MKVKVVNTFWYQDEGRYVYPGEELELSMATAQRLARIGCVEEIREIKPKRKPRPGHNKAMQPQENK